MPIKNSSLYALCLFIACCTIAVRSATAANPSGSDCELYKSWLVDVSDIPYVVLWNRSHSVSQKREKPALAVPRIAWLVTDARSKKLFGTTFDAIPDKERERWLNVAERCHVRMSNNGKDNATQVGSLSKVFRDPRLHQQAVDGVKTIRAARARLDQITAAFPGLTSSEKDVAKFRALYEEAEPLRTFADTARERDFDNARALAFRNTVDRMHQERLLQAARDASGYDDLVAIGKLIAEAEEETSTYGVGISWPPEFDEMRKKLLHDLAASEKAQIDEFRDGLEGIRLGAVWQKESRGRLKAIRAPMDWYWDINNYFDAMRGQALIDSKADLQALIYKADTHAKLNSVITTYLPLDTDKDNVAGREILANAYAQGLVIEKARALGITVRQAVNATNTTGNGPPTAGDIYDYVNQIVLSVNAGAESVIRDCNMALRREARLGPIEATTCFFIGAGQGALENSGPINAPRFRIASFRQSGQCVSAGNAPGWICDYSYTVTGNPALGLVNRLNATGKPLRSRFVWERGRWVTANG